MQYVTPPGSEYSYLLAADRFALLKTLYEQVEQQAYSSRAPQSYAGSISGDSAPHSIALRHMPSTGSVSQAEGGNCDLFTSSASWASGVHS
jgi:hypothetical protein